MATITIPGMFLTGTHASRPAANDVGSGSLYACSTHGKLYQSDGSSWTDWYTPAAAASTLHGCRVYNSATQNVSNTTDTQLTFDSEEYDTDAYHDTSSNPSRITIPTGLGGYYLVRGHTTWSASATGERIMVLRKNGSDVRGASTSTPVNSSSLGTRQIVSAVLSLAAGDYLQVNTYQNSGGTRTAGGSGGDASTFEAILLGV